MSRRQTVGFVSATVLESTLVADLVYLKTELPSPMPGVTKALLHLSFEAEAGTGAAYVREHFGIEPEIVGDGKEGV